MNLSSVYTINLPSFEDSRGVLSVVEATTDIPFGIERIFFIHHVISDRGGHAHIDTDQVIIPISGSLKVKVFDGVNEDIYLLNDCRTGLFAPALTFCDLYDFSPGGVCLVLASTKYNMKKSLRSKAEYLQYLKQSKKNGG